MRRGALNSTAVKLGCNKVALGHHGDDLIETFFLSLMYEGRLSTFSPVTYLERANLHVLRPMIYLREYQVASFAKDLPVLHNPCPVNHKTQREYVKNLLKEIRKDIPIVNDNVLNALLHPERNNLIKRPEKPEK
jgi:tRNA(Ile)-lysidine synthase TilS/MesJ